MKKDHLDVARIWGDIEEHFATTFSLWASDRVVLFYLTRKIRLAGQHSALMPVRTLSRATLLFRSTVCIALRRLVARGILRILSRTYKGLRLRLKLPHEIPGCVRQDRLPDGRSLESIDFWTSKLRRTAIHACPAGNRTC